MGAQELERDYELRIKFASLDDEGHLQYDAIEEYKDFFQKQDLPEG
jgi:hypothetical protein